MDVAVPLPPAVGTGDAVLDAPEPTPSDDVGGAPALLSVSHLTKSYGSRRAVDDVSFTATPGITGLLGPNGAGKTTLLRCVAGLSGWDSGEVRIDGIDLARRPAEARGRIGFMPERVSFPAEMRVAEYLRFVSEMKGIAKATRGGAVEAVLEQAGLQASRERIIGNLSKGYRQRVGLAQALLGDAPVVLLDEPSAGLDPLSVMEFRQVLRQCALERTVLVSTHLLPEARLLCDRVILMTQGHLVYDGPVAGMVRAGGEAFQYRIRVRRVTGQPRPPSVDTPGARLVHSQGGEGDHVLVVAVDDEDAVGTLVADLVVAGWSVLGVEPTMDALEESFRSAVAGDRREPGDGA